MPRLFSLERQRRLRADFFAEDFRPDFFAEVFLPDDFFAADFARGTFAPFSRASDNPIAIACFLLVTFFPPLPERNVPLFLRRIADSTLLPAALPYFLPPDDFRAAIVRSFSWLGVMIAAQLANLQKVSP
jgi:hypothetical protein